MGEHRSLGNISRWEGNDMDIDEFFIRLGRVIGNGTGIETGKDDALYWRFGHFVTALFTILALLGIVGLVALLISKMQTKRRKK